MAQLSWIGATLGSRYEITERLGQGGMSTVYKATDHNSNRIVAVKIIHPRLTGDPEFARRFEREARTVLQLNHPNIIQVHEFNQEAETFYLVVEFVPGESLQDRLKRLRKTERHLPVGEAIEIAAKTAAGLHHAHTLNILHYNIKPSNIMLNVYGEPVLMDFGLVKIMGVEHTAGGSLVDAVKYRAPEQIKGERIDARTDIYALGATLFEMLSGHPPFEAPSDMTLMMKAISEPAPNLAELRADVPAEVVAVVNRALAKAPSERYASAEQFADDLRDSLGSGAVTVVDATVIDSSEEPAPPPPKAETPVAPPTALDDDSSTGGARRVIIAAGLLLGLLIIIALIWLLFFQ